MKKFLSIVLAAALSLSSLGITAFAAETEEALSEGTESTATKEVLQVTETGSALPNVYAKMHAAKAAAAETKETIRVGYFGGSVTNGYGASKQAETSWRGLSLSWFNETYGDEYNVQFVESTRDDNVREHAGNGGTGTDLNVYRADKVLGLTQNNPYDLVFIEFAINDSYEQNSYAKSAYYMESIIQKIRLKSPTTDIVVVLTTDYGKKDTEFTNAKAHADVAAHYNVPAFWIGKYMWPFLVEEAGSETVPSGAHPWTTYYKGAGDCHPNDAGYQKYFEFLRDYLLKPALDENENYSTTVVNYTIPETNYNTTDAFKEMDTAGEYYNKELASDASMVYGSEVENYENAFGGFKSNATTVTTYDAGSSFKAVFNSTSAGIIYNGINVNGLLLYSVDGGDYQVKDLYSTRADGSQEYFMFYEDLEPGEHTVDVILRRSPNGTRCTIYGFILIGDTENKGVSYASPAPTSALNDELYIHTITLTPDLLKTVISGGDYTNDGSTFDNYHLGIIDTGVLRYVPNTASSERVASDCYNSTFRTVTTENYKYAVIDYYYLVEQGTATAEGNRQLMSMLNIPCSTEPKSLYLFSADKIVANQRAYSLVDLTPIKARLGYEGKLVQMHFSPYGDIKGNQLTENDIMNVVDVTFYADYPSEIKLNGKQVYFKEITVDVAKEITETASSISLDGKKILPSTHKYATIKYNYSGSENAKLSLTFTGLDYGESTATVTSKALSAGENEIIVNLTDIAESGQMYYYTNVDAALVTEPAADTALMADETAALTIESITFTTEYPDPDAVFEISFDANGGTGTVPSPITGAIGASVTLPDANMENGTQLFLGWSTEKDGSNIVTEVTIPADGMTLYATYTDAALLTYDLNGGTGDIPSEIKVAVGKETSLMPGTTIKNGNKIFLGWGVSKDATATVNKITMTEDGVTVYAIYKELQTVYVAADGVLTYNGSEYEADYTNIADAFTALGKNGGHIIFEGVFPGTTSIGVSGAPLYILEGADDTAGLTFTGYTVNFVCNTTLKNMAFLRYSEDPYFYANGHSLIFDEGFGFYLYDETAANYRGTEAGLKGGLRGGKAVLNDGMIGTYFTGGNYNGNSSGNTYMEFNGGTTYGFTMGSYYFNQYDANSFTHTGNATVVVNGGTFSSKTIKVDHNSKFPTTVTGATSVILNNGITDFTFDSKVKYVIQSAVGGKVSLAADGTSSYAPTFLIKANNADSRILINGDEVEAANGEYLFMPKSTGTFNITYAGATKVYANSDGSGKLTVDGVEHKAYDTITEAAANLDSAGGTIYFDGDQSLFDLVTVSTGGYKSLTVIGTSDKSVMVFDKKAQPAAFGCDITIKNCHFRNDVSDNWPYLRTGKYTVTIGGLDDTVKMTVTKKNSSGTYDASAFEAIVTETGGKYIVNAGNFSKLGQNYSGIGNNDVVAIINGGTVSAAGLRPFYGNYNNAASVLNGNYVVTVNGGTLSGTAIDYAANSNIKNNGILIFNNGLKSAQAYTIANVGYIVDAPENIHVEATAYGNATTAPTFTLTPAEGVEKVFVNKAEVTAVDGVYTYTPTATGTFVVEADLVLPMATFVAGEGTTGRAPANVAAEAGADVAIPTCDLAKEGYRLAGWATTEGLVNPEYTTTVKMPEGGITLYPVWRPEVYFVTNEQSGTVTYDGVTYTADYTKLSDALKAMGTSGHIAFTGVFDYTDFFVSGTSVANVTLEGADDDAILRFESAINTSTNKAAAINAYFYYNITFKNVKLLKAIHDLGSASDLYFNGNGKTVIFDGTETYIEDGADTNKLKEKASLQGYNFGKVITNSGNYTNNFHIGGYTANSSGNKYLEIDGTANFATPIQLGVLDWNWNPPATPRTHTGNITLVINGGVFGDTHEIRVDKNAAENLITNVTGAVSAIINNGIADKTTFTIDSKVEYIVKSSKGGMVTLKSEGSETTAPSFLIKADTNKAILINGNEVEDVNGEYTLTPEAAGTYIVTYKEKPTKVDFNISFDAKSDLSRVVVDDETGYDARAIITITDETGESRYAPLETNGATEAESTISYYTTSGVYSFKITKPGYITYEGTFTVYEDGTVEMDALPELIAGDIRGSYEATEGDGVINLDDFIRVLRGFNDLGSETKLLRQVVDLNEDGQLNVQDLSIIKANYGKTAASYNTAE